MEKTFRIDSEQLILAIKRYEHIWNKDKKEYHKKTMKEAAWNSLCEELVEDWETLSEEEKNFKQLELKKRWNNIRDYYKKDLTIQMSGNSTKRKRYMFSNKLEFLRPFLGKICPTERTSDDDNQEEDPECYELHFETDSEDESLPLKSKTVTKIEESTSKAQEESIEDECDMLFLKSLAPDMKVLNRRQKIDFKLGILQLYKHIINDTQYRPMDPLNEECEEKKFVLH